VRIDLSDFPGRARMALAWSNGEGEAFEIETPRGPVDVAGARVVWWRRVRGFDVDAAITAPQARAFAESETGQAINGMLEALKCPWVNPRQADAAAHHKPYQGSVAQALGLRLPRTLVTTKPEAAREFIDRIGVGRTVFKAFLASIGDWRETRLVERDDLDKLELVRYAPVIFQEYVEGVDLRITVVGSEIFAAEIDARKTSYPVDMRMSIGEGSFRPVELPAAVARAVLRLQRRLNLDYGAIDMRRTHDGEHVFLEVNPAGQWMFVEQRTGLPISAAMANRLGALADRPPGRGRGHST
jgi:glutathione synthase/RimK-type ligase-like ATP-grasp enzyme